MRVLVLVLLILICVHQWLLAAMPLVGVLPRFARVIAVRRRALSAGSNGDDPLSPARQAGLPNRTRKQASKQAATGGPGPVGLGPVFLGTCVPGTWAR